MVQEAVERIDVLAATRGISIQVELEPVQMRGVADYLKMLLDNLLSNAVSYSLDGGAVQVACRHCGPTQACIEVRDHGIGIPAEKLPHVFEDYYRTTEAVKHNRASTGLGLAVVRLVARALGAAVRVESAPGWGTRFTVSFPNQHRGAEVESSDREVGCRSVR